MMKSPMNWDKKLIGEAHVNTIFFSDLLDLFREHLDVVVRGDVIPGEVDERWGGTKYAWDFEPADDIYPFGQNTYSVFNPKDYENFTEEDDPFGKFESYMARLFKKGILPIDKPLFVDIWW